MIREVRVMEMIVVIVSLPAPMIGNSCTNDWEHMMVCKDQTHGVRLRPASSVMLRNINILEFDDATEMPKQNHGKRGEKEDVGKKRTQGNISLLRLLKQNLHH
ncbi:hypothetical protein CTI12_AA174080 [Artemisia annua]|uniref:Uncharacterized protein n=1 Tax=Artemisia annua TaxID=35608 RepID=A0A2U1PA51_ARTAN|nr:hypothetical protein CTI12_AA174080 [Artemisia annua]